MGLVAKVSEMLSMHLQGDASSKNPSRSTKEEHKSKQEHMSSHMQPPLHAPSRINHHLINCDGMIDQQGGVHRQPCGGNPFRSRLEKQLWGRNLSRRVVVGQGEHLGAVLPHYVFPDIYTSGLGHVLIVGIIALPSPAVPLSAGAMSMPVLYLSAAAAFTSSPHPRLLTSLLELFQDPLAALSSAKRFSAKRPSHKYH